MPFPVYAFAELGVAPPNEHKLHAEIVAAGPYATNFLGVTTDHNASTVTTVFDAPPSMGDQAVVDGVIAAHDGVESPMPSALFVLSQEFTAGAGGAPDDVVIYDGDAPYGFRVVESFLYVSTLVALATAQLRDALGGAGNTLSDAWLASILGVQVNVNLAVPPVVPTGGTLVLRRSDSGVAGTLVLYVERIG